MAEPKLTDMAKDQLQAELERARLALEDNEELRRSFLGQTGVHIGIRVLRSARRQFDQEEARLKERIATIENLVATGSGSAPHNSETADCQK